MSNEKALIGALILSQGRLLDELTIRPDDFLSPAYEAIFRTMQSMHQAGTGIDSITLGDALPKYAEMMFEATSFTPTAANGEFYAQGVQEEALRRRLGSVAETLRATALDAERKVVPDEVRKVVDDALGATVGRVTFVSDEIGNTIASLGVKQEMHASPWTNLNKVIGGFRPGCLYIIAARPGVGKTVIGLQLALHFAKTGAVAFSSLEMSAEELHKRMISQLADVHMAELKGMEPMSDLGRRRAIKARSLMTLPLAIDDRAGVNIHDIRTFARSVAHQMSLQAVVVDYVGLIADASGKDKSRYETVTQISQQLKVMARDLNVPVIALAQLNREVENRKDNKPMLSDLRDSGSLEQDADVVILLRRDLIGDKNTITLDVAKNRHGETKTLDLGFQGEYSRATNEQIRK